MAQGTESIVQEASGKASTKKISLALFLAGFATFSLLYCTQPLLPEFTADFGITPAASSLSVSLTTGFLAVSILCAGALSESFGRRGLMFVSMSGAAVLNLIAAHAPTWEVLLVMRALEGLMLGGVPAVAMAYLAEEIPAVRLGFVMGLYVAGTAFGGMAGRVAVGVLTDHFDWHMALEIVAIADLICAAGFFILLPRSRNFTRRKSLGAVYHLGAWKAHLVSPALPLLFACGFLCLGIFVTIYNYVGFRLSAAPYFLSQSQIGLIFLSYTFGMGASSIAGAFADRVGRAPVMMAGGLITMVGLGLTMLAPLVAVIAGVIGMTIGFFTVHAVASGWVGRLARTNKSHASSLYMLAYYGGSSVVGSSGGWFWHAGGWAALMAFCGVLTIMLLALAAVLRVKGA